MNEAILQILNSFYYPESPKFLDYVSQAEYNKIVAEIISERLEKVYSTPTK